MIPIKAIEQCHNCQHDYAGSRIIVANRHLDKQSPLRTMVPEKICHQCAEGILTGTMAEGWWDRASLTKAYVVKLTALNMQMFDLMEDLADGGVCPSHSYEPGCSVCVWGRMRTYAA